MLQYIAFGQFPNLGMWLVIGIVAVLLFGRRLPEVGRSLGKGIVEFKKGLKGIDDDIDRGTPTDNTTTTTTQAALPGHKFDPYTGKPLTASEAPAHKFDPETGKPLDQHT